MDQKRLIKELLEKYWIVGIDTAAFIYHFEENKEYLPFTDVLFEMIETGKIRGVTSTITLMEVLVKPKRDGNERAVDEYKFILQTFPNLEIRQVDAEVAERAAEIRARYGVRPPDALQVAASLANNADAFITNDEELKRIREIEIVIMKEVLTMKHKD